MWLYCIESEGREVHETHIPGCRWYERRQMRSHHCLLQARHSYFLRFAIRCRNVSSFAKLCSHSMTANLFDSIVVRVCTMQFCCTPFFIPLLHTNKNKPFSLVLWHLTVQGCVCICVCGPCFDNSTCLVSMWTHSMPAGEYIQCPFFGYFDLLWEDF